MPAIDDARRIQFDLNLGALHVFWVDIDTDSFVIAHTDPERLAAAEPVAREYLRVPDPVPLTQCSLHQFLAGHYYLDHLLCCAYCHAPRFLFPETGWYTVDVTKSDLHDIRGLAL